MEFFLKNGELSSEAVGSFTQYPVRLAFAVTIHKSQGKTFERAIIDVGRGIVYTNLFPLLFPIP